MPNGQERDQFGENEPKRLPLAGIDEDSDVQVVSVGQHITLSGGNMGECTGEKTAS